MANPPGSEFGSDFFKYVLGPVGETITQFAQSALPTPSGLPQLGIPGVTTPGYGGGYVPNAGPEPYRTGYVPNSEGSVPFLAKIWDPANAAKVKSTAAAAQSIQPRPQGAAAIPYAGGYAPNVQRFTSQIKQAAADTGVPERVLASIVHIECPGCDPSTVNKAGAVGLGQVVHGPTDPLENLRAAGNLLREKQRIFGIDPNDWNSTAAAYFGAYRPGVGITGDQDMNGVNGFSYVDQFKNAYGIYPDILGGVTPPQPTAAQQATVSGGAFPPVQNSVASARPTQFDPWLSKDEQLAACGPAVVAGLAGISVRQATDDAAKAGVWSAASGMSGSASESQQLTQHGVKNTWIQNVNLSQARDMVDSGRPVIFSMAYVSDARPGHYYLADAYDPKSGRFHVGQSGLDLKVHSDWMTIEQMSQMGPPEGMIVIEK